MGSRVVAAAAVVLFLLPAYVGVAEGLSQDAMRGVVVDENGHLVPGATVVLVRDDPTIRSFVPSGDVVETDGGGRFVLPLSAESRRFVLVQADGASVVVPAQAGGPTEIVLSDSPDFTAFQSTARSGVDLPKRVRAAHPSMADNVPQVAPAVREALTAGLPGGPVVAPTDPAFWTVQYFANDVVSTPYPINVPYPLDVNGDLAPEGTIWANVDLSSNLAIRRVCLDFDLTVGSVVDELEGAIGVIYNGLFVGFDSDRFPDVGSACMTFQSDGSVEGVLDTSSPATSRRFMLFGGNAESLAFAQFNAPPQGVSVTFRPISNERLVVDYRATTTWDVVVGYQGETLSAWAQIDGVPTSFTIDLETWVDPDSVEVFLHYDAASAATRLIAQIDTPGTAGPVTAFIEPLPSSLAEDIRFYSPYEDFWEVEVDHSASSAISRLRAWGNVKGLDSYAQVDEVPTGLNTLVRGIMSSGSLKSLYVNHYSGLSGIAKIVVYGYNASSELYMEAGSLPGSFVATFSARDFSAGGRPIPSLRVSATSAGAWVYGHVEGEMLRGGFLDILLEGIPRQLETTFPAAAFNEALNINYDGRTDGLDLLYVDAYLPEALKDAAVKKFRIYAEDLARLEISQRKVNVNPFPCVGCQYWSNRNLGYASIQHGDVALLGLHLHALWKAQECPQGYSRSTCDSFGLWKDRYLTYDIDTLLHDPTYLSSSSSSIRFVAWAFY